MLCVKHNKEMEIFCNKCDAEICLRCSLEDHKGHDTVLLVALAESWQKEMSNGIEELVSRSKKLDQFEHKLEAVIQEINQVTNEIIDLPFQSVLPDRIPRLISQRKLKNNMKQFKRH